MTVSVPPLTLTTAPSLLQHSEHRGAHSAVATVTEEEAEANAKAEEVGTDADGDRGRGF
jgi:hypothetical protein